MTIFNNINPSKTVVWSIFPFLCIIFSFLYQYFIVLSVLSLLASWSGLFLEIYICFFQCPFKGDFFFLTFSFWYFIVSVKKCNWFLYVNLVSCYLAEFITSNSFCMKSFRFSIYSIMSSAYNENFTSSLPIRILFIFFFSDCCD